MTKQIFLIFRARPGSRENLKKTPKRPISTAEGRRGRLSAQPGQVRKEAAVGEFYRVVSGLPLLMFGALRAGKTRLTDACKVIYYQ